MGGVRGVDAHIHDVFDVGNVVGALRKCGDVPSSVAELVEPVGPKLGRPRGTDPSGGNPEVVVPAIHPAHRRIGWTQGPIGAGGNALCGWLRGPSHDAAHGACNPHAALDVLRPHRQALNVHKGGEGVVDGHRFSLGVPSPGLTARGHNQAGLSRAIRSQNPRPFCHATPWQPILIPTGHHFPESVICAAPYHSVVALWNFGGHPPCVCEAFQGENCAEVGGKRPGFPAVWVGEEGVRLGSAQDPQVRAHEPLAFKRHHATGIHRNVCRREAPRVRDFLFLQVEDNHPNCRGQIRVLSFNGDGLDALAAHNLGNAQFGTVGDAPAVAEVDASVVVGHHPVVAKGVVTECGWIALAQPWPLTKRDTS